MLLIDFSFGFIYDDIEGPCHGGLTGNETRVEFSDDEYIAEISGWVGDQVNQVTHSYISIVGFVQKYGFDPVLLPDFCCKQT